MQFKGFFRKLGAVAFAGAILASFASGCRRSPDQVVLRVGVTSSTRDSGLMDLLVPMFESQSGVRVDLIAAGTGKILKLGRDGEIDVAVVHSRTDEDQFMADGHGSRHEELMENWFVIVGPEKDPAGIRSLDPIAALTKIDRNKSLFVSRGDRSGTHQRELQLWEKAKRKPGGSSYLESGQGMGATLTIADQKSAYTLSDSGTYFSMSDKLRLVRFSTNDPSLRNIYSAIVVADQQDSRLDANPASQFVDFLISRPAQDAIGEYRVNGKLLFYPLRLPAGDRQ